MHRKYFHHRGSNRRSNPITKMYAKSNTQHGRRTPLSLNAGKQQPQPNHNKPATGTNGNSNTVLTKNDNKNTHQKTGEPSLVELKEPIQKETKRQQNQQTVEKKQQQPNSIESVNKNAEKSEEQKAQNGNIGKNNGNDKDKQTQQQQQKQQNSDDNINEIVVKAKKDKIVEKVDKNEKVENSEMPAKDEKKEKEDNTEKAVEKKEKEAKPDGRKKQQEKHEVEKIDVINSEEKVAAVAALPVTPTKPTVVQKTSTPNKAAAATHNKSAAVIPTKSSEKTTMPMTTIVIDDNDDDVEMEPLIIETSPKTHLQNAELIAPAACGVAIKPTATSTPGKDTINKRAPTSEVQLTLQRGGTPDRRNCPSSYIQISGRRSIRPISDYTSHFQSDLHFRESYRRINTELDVTSTTNTSLNVTVGSEVPNNSSFSFFGRGRKRDRTPPLQSQSAIELQTDIEISPPKRARLDMQGFLSIVASPLSLLRSRFSKASIQSSTPVKLRSKLAAEDEESEVQNVSGVSFNEEFANGDSGEEVTATGDDVDGADGDETPKTDLLLAEGGVAAENSTEQSANEIKDHKKCALEQATTTDGDNNDDIMIKETPLMGAVSDPLVKNRRCSIM